MLLSIFCAIVFVFLGIAWNQIVHHSDSPTSYAAEFTGNLNAILLISIGVFFSSVVGKMFGIKSEETRAAIDQAAGIAKEMRVITEDKLQPSPNTDNQP